ncbi:MAG: MGMT family protein [Fimbriimonadaceae bacterium]
MDLEPFGAPSAQSYLFRLVEQIPERRLTYYGALGKALPNPVSGLIVGRWMTQCPLDLPWWRVIAKDGRLVIGKRSPELLGVQSELLKAEGHTVKDFCVQPPHDFWLPEQTR